MRISINGTDVELTRGKIPPGTKKKIHNRAAEVEILFAVIGHIHYWEIQTGEIQTGQPLSRPV